MAIIEAAAALDAGLCDYAALIYANIGRSRRVNYGGDESPGVWDPWGFTSPGAAHALMFQRHRALYGTTTRQLAEVSVAFRHHACLNPSAVMKQPITIDDHEAARFITEPLRLLDYCLINDGAVCIIMTTKERARDLKKRPVMISGIGAREAYSTASLSNFDLNFWYDEMRDVADQAYGMAGVGPSDVDALMCYDNFSPTVLFSLEGLGFCGKFVGSGHGRHGGLVFEALLRRLKGGGEVEDLLAVLDGDHPAGGKAAAVAGPVDIEEDRCGRVARADEIAVQGMADPVLDRAIGGQQGLGDDLPAENPARALVR
jgi:acetyl-CoA acetyltransferase